MYIYQICISTNWNSHCMPLVFDLSVNNEKVCIPDSQGALPAVDVFAITGAFQWHLAFMSKCSTQLDFFTDGRLVFSQCPSDGRFCGAIGNACKDNSSVIQGQM